MPETTVYSSLYITVAKNISVSLSTSLLCYRSSVCLTVCRMSIVCRLSVCLYSGDWNFRPCLHVIWYLGHLWPFDKSFSEIVPGESLRRGLNARGVAKYSDFGPFEGHNRKRCKIVCKLILITNRKSHMSFRLVPKLVTLIGLERHNSLLSLQNFTNSVAFGRIT